MDSSYAQPRPQSWNKPADTDTGSIVCFASHLTSFKPPHWILNRAWHNLSDTWLCEKGLTQSRYCNYSGYVSPGHSHSISTLRSRWCLGPQGVWQAANWFFCSDGSRWLNLTRPPTLLLWRVIMVPFEKKKSSEVEWMPGLIWPVIRI